MEIVSVQFALLTLASFFIYYLLTNKARIWFLVLLSCAFIGSLSLNLLIYVLFYSLFNFLVGLKIPGTKHKKAVYKTGIIINLAQLILLKYSSFLIDPVLGLFDPSIRVSGLAEIIYPLGISYFTLQGIGYLINVKMGWEKAETRLPDFILYFVFFPKFLSGPVERSNHFLPQVKAIRDFDRRQVSEGLRMALFGFFKKVVIANYLGTLVTGTYSDISSTGGINLWLVLVIQPLYLYFDFSGYTDIAIGFAKIYGINLLPNFNRPFLAENVTNFWKRFHMSLSFWFNDYVFKQLSFKYRRWGKYAAVFAVFVTFTLFGIWHGAGWTFMILGFMQALALNYEFFTKRKRTELFGKVPSGVKVHFGRILTYLFYGVSLVFFFSPDMNTVFAFFGGLNDFSTELSPVVTKTWFIIALILSMIFMAYELLAEDYHAASKDVERYWNRHSWLRISIYFVMVMLILMHIGKKVSFVYEVF